LVIFVFVIYLVFAQLMAPFSLYTVDLIGISKAELGVLFMINGLIVAFFQLPTTHLLKNMRLTSQLALGSIIFSCGYIVVGLSATFILFILAIIIITLGENCVSPPALALTANLAPEGRTGRYMGIYGFAVTIGWSLGPLIGLTLLDSFKPNYLYAWMIISLLGIIAMIGFKLLSRMIPEDINRPRK
ncbi:MAG: MFS transporter, partial [candidate division Zixibacteria bacterium]|nr:MFS transporter [candidate division Zixibacteria bacterium]